ncbi:Spy/CpxP family protein refolding chaperone [Halomonas shantousis]
MTEPLPDSISRNGRRQIMNILWRSLLLASSLGLAVSTAQAHQPMMGGGQGMMGGGQGMMGGGQGMMGGGQGMMGGGPGMMGGGPGMMGGGQGMMGGGQGMMGGGQGMMGGGQGMMGGGQGMMGGGPGMMGDYNCGPGNGPFSDLDEQQRQQLTQIHDQLRQQQWPLMQQMHQYMWEFNNLTAQPDADAEAVGDKYAQLFELRQQMARNMREAQERMQQVVNPQE